MDHHKETSENNYLTEAEQHKESADKHKRQLISAWKTFGITGVFVLAAAGSLILICLAWFVRNSQVRGGSVSVSAEQNIVRIASKGDRQTAELRSDLNLPEGTAYEYGGETYYYTENEEIAMHLAEDYNVSPGASGSFDFYIIPTSNGARTVTLYLGLAGYRKGETEKAIPVEDETLNALLKGHILLFKNYENRFYSGWLHNQNSDGIFQNTITITLPEDAEAGVPYPYTIYWIWPKRYENMISHRPYNKDLYAPNSSEFATVFLPFVEAQSADANANQIGTSNYRYSSVFLSDIWPLNETKARSNAYNLADEYIGTNADYLYLTIRTAS